MRFAWIAAGVLIILTQTTAAAPASKDAREVRTIVERGIGSVLVVLKDSRASREEKKARVQSVMDEIFDIPLMGKLALGKKRWPKFSEVQRREFTKLFVVTIHDSFFKKLELFTDETVDFKEPLPLKKGKYKMSTSVDSKGNVYVLVYKLYRKGASWRVYDIEIQGVSLVRTFGAQYDQFLEKSSIDSLLKIMKQKALGRPEELSESENSIADQEKF